MDLVPETLPYRVHLRGELGKLRHTGDATDFLAAVDDGLLDRCELPKDVAGLTSRFQDQSLVVGGDSADRGIVSAVSVYGPGPAGALPDAFGGAPVATVAPEDPTPGIRALTDRCIEAYAYSTNIFMRDSAAGVGTLVLSHLAPGDVGSVSDERWIAKASQTFSGRVVTRSAGWENASLFRSCIRRSRVSVRTRE